MNEYDGINLNNNGEIDEETLSLWDKAVKKSLFRVQLAKLINMKSIITMCVLLVFVILSLKEVLPVKDTFTIILMSVTYFLGYQTKKKADDK